MNPPIRDTSAAHSSRTWRTPCPLLRTILTALLLITLFPSLPAQSPLPATNTALDFGNVIAGEPSVQWFKVVQAYPTLTASTTPSSPFTVILVEDVGFGHGQPPSDTFAPTFTSTCFNCWLGVQFLPATPGPQTSALAILLPNTSAPYALTLTGTGTAYSGLLLTPVAQQFNATPANSTSAPTLFMLTNLASTGSSITVSPPSLTGEFAVSTLPTGGIPCGGSLAYTASCFSSVSFAPTTPGPRTGSLTLQTSSGSAVAELTGTSSPDPGLALNPASLIFSSIAGPAATQQSITLANTTSSPIQIATPTTSTPSFAASTNCAALAPAATCSILITFTPTSAPASSILTIPVTNLNGTPATTNFAVPLTGAYTIDNAGLEITPADPQFGPQSVGALSLARQFTITNLSAKYATLSFNLPRQFVLTSAPCATLAPNASCTFSLSFLPLTNADITGTLFAQAAPTDGSAMLDGIAYVEGYGLATNTLSITGPLQPGAVLDFGQLASGKTAQRTLTLSNSSASAMLSIRRITSLWPFLSTSTCGSSLAPSASCTVTLTYTPTNQVANSASPPPSTTDTNVLVIESDAASSPDLINLTGSSTPIIVATPSNAAMQPVLSLSTSSLNFATLPAGGTSPTQPVTLTNIGTATLNLSSIQSSNPDFTVATTCATLQPGDTCTIAIGFAPQTATGASLRTGAIEISSNASSPLEFFSVMGTAAPTAQATLTAAPTALLFGSVVLGASSTLSLQLTNSGSTAATSLAYSATGDFTVSTGTCGNSLAPGATCSLQITFTPTQASARTGALLIATSAVAQTLAVPLSGTGTLAGSFALTVDGAATASATVKSGSSATYSLAATPLNHFNGTVAFTCTPIALAAYTTCTIAPASVTLAASAQSAIVTIGTLTVLGQNSPPPVHTRTLAEAATLCLIFPALLFSSRSRRKRRFTLLQALIATLALISTLACGNSKITPSPNRYAAAGTYQFLVTAASSNAGGPVTQTVTLNLTVQ